MDTEVLTEVSAGRIIVTPDPDGHGYTARRLGKVAPVGFGDRPVSAIRSLFVKEDEG